MSDQKSELTKVQATNTKQINRRSVIKYFTKIGAVGLAGYLGGSLLNGSVFSATKSFLTGKEKKYKFHYGMVIDTRRCVGCRACVINN
jgi:hypothetical protein